MKEIGLRIKKARQAKGLKQEDLAERIGAKSSAAVSAWEVGKARPDCVTLLELCKVLSVAPDEILGYDADLPSSHEWSMIRKYRQIDAYGKKAVDAVLDAEHERATSTHHTKQKPRMIMLDFYNYPASAGLGNFLESEEAEKLWVKDSPEAQAADYAISISGDSMEPTYRDGECVLVEKCDTLSIGEVGIFIVNGDAYIKELGEGCLISHNEKYSPIDLGDADSVYCCGRVIGVAVK